MNVDGGTSSSKTLSRNKHERRVSLLLVSEVLLTNVLKTSKRVVLSEAEQIVC